MLVISGRHCSDSIPKRSIVTVRDLRYEAGIPADGTPEDALVRLNLFQKSVRGLSKESVPTHSSKRQISFARWEFSWIVAPTYPFGPSTKLSSFD